MEYYGNLALRPERKPQQTAKPVTQREKVIRRRHLPLGEKLLYIFTLAVGVSVAGLIIYRYAEIYQMNRQIQELNHKFEQTTVQMKEMQREVERLSDPQRISEYAGKQLGMVAGDPHGITVGEDVNALAMKP
jgi:cell division protein FtsL